MNIQNPYHAGELAVQERANESESAVMNGGALATTIPAGALHFIAQQPMVVAGSIDSQGRVWVSVLLGEPGFIHAIDNKTLSIDLSQPRSAIDDPLWRNLDQQAIIGLIVIELGSRRRLRISGQAKKVSDNSYVINVERAYPNCPKYIQRRVWRKPESSSPVTASTGTGGEKITNIHKALIRSADTFFVASSHPDQGVDASHRGGHPGFVQLVSDNQLRIPDFAGNSMFNTLGNFSMYPYAGLAFIDFEQGRLLQLTGRAEILWDEDDPAAETGGTQRYWQFEITSWRESMLPFRLEWEYMDASPHIPKPVNEKQSSDTLSLRVERIKQESELIKSFRLRSVDGSLLPEFQAGAHLRIKVPLPDGSTAERHYSLLSNPNDTQNYEIAVLLEPEGRGGSRYMHEQISEGDVIESDMPKNEFTLAENASHSILIAGGIGITPILSMMQQLASKDRSFEIHYSARTSDALVLRDRIESIAGDRAHFYTSQGAGGQRPDLAHILAVPNSHTHVYVCGPRRMVTGVRDTAIAQGWSPAQIHFESFGSRPADEDSAFEVYLEKSKQSFTVPRTGTILDTLLEAGVKVPHQCKRGECRMCVTRVLEGDAEHRDLCLSKEEQADSICLCVSRTRSDKLTLDL